MYEKYYSLDNRNIEVKLKDARVLQGSIAGFFRGEDYENEPYIWQWHLVSPGKENMLGVDAFGYTEGALILQQDIIQVKFYQDNSILNFKQDKQ